MKKIIVDTQANKASLSKLTKPKLIKSYLLALAIITNPMYITSAFATNGFLGHCIGPFKCATGGAGAASATSAVDGLINPALISKQDNNWLVDVKLLHVNLTMDTSAAPAGNNVGRQKSRLTDFPDLSAGFAYSVNDEVTVALALAASGGMAVKYKYPRTNPLAQASPPFDSTAMYRLAHVAPTVSWKIKDNVSVGASFLLGYSDFKTNSASSTPNANQFVQANARNKRQSAWGYGGRLGVLWDVNDVVTLGASYATPVLFKKFTKYNDILLGPINTPMNFVVGALWHVTPNTDFLFDIKQVFYNKVKAVGTIPAKGGFGWNNQTIFMVGITQYYDKWSGSLGYSYGKSPIAKDKTFANGLFPAIVEQHFTAGVGYKMTEDVELRLGGFYVPKKTQVDPGTGDMFSRFGKGTKINMYQYGFFLGAKYNF